MAIKRGIQYFWDTTTNEWVEFYPKASLALMEETTTRKIFTADEQTKIANYLNTFNAANKLIKLDASGKFSNSYMDIDSSINLNSNIINDASRINFNDTGYISQVNGDLVIFNGSSNNIVLNGNTNISRSLNFTSNVAENAKINGISEINFLEDGSEYINAYKNGNESQIEIGWNSFGPKYIVLRESQLQLVNKRITQLADPIAATDAVNRQWVEQFVAQGTHVVAAVRVASTTNITSLSGTGTTIDGVTLAAEDRVLVKDQDTSAQNGIYIVKAGAWTKLPHDSDKGSLAFVLEGATNKGKQYYNSDGTTWTLFFVQDTYYATENGGLKLDSDGFGFSIKSNGVTNGMLAGNISATKLMLLSSGGLESNNGNLAIKSGGVTNGMLAGSIFWSKIASEYSGYTSAGTWASLVDIYESKKTIGEHFRDLYTAVKLLRGTDDYKTDNTETIAGAYLAASDANTQATGRSKVFYRTAAESLPTLADIGTLTGGVTAVCYKEYTE